MAISLGVYNDLLDILSNFYKLKIIKKHWQMIVGMMLGACLSFTLFMVVYNKFPYLFLSLFVGFILSSFRKNKCTFKNKWYHYMLMFLIILFVFVINMVGNFRIISFDENITFFKVYIIFLIGILASLALILPGISGAMILFVFGIYDLILKTIQDIISCIKTFQPLTEGNIVIIMPFIVGFIVGILAFSKIIDKISKSKPHLFSIISNGFLFGSLLILACNLFNIVTFPYIFIICAILIVLGCIIGNKIIKEV